MPWQDNPRIVWPQVWRFGCTMIPALTNMGTLHMFS